MARGMPYFTLDYVSMMPQSCVTMLDKRLQALRTTLPFVLHSMLLQWIDFDDDVGNADVGDRGDDLPAPRRAACGSNLLLQLLAEGLNARSRLAAAKRVARRDRCPSSALNKSCSSFSSCDVLAVHLYMLDLTHLGR